MPKTQRQEDLGSVIAGILGRLHKLEWSRSASGDRLAEAFIRITGDTFGNSVYEAGQGSFYVPVVDTEFAYQTVVTLPLTRGTGAGFGAQISGQNAGDSDLTFTLVGAYLTVVNMDATQVFKARRYTDLTFDSFGGTDIVFDDHMTGVGSDLGFNGDNSRVITSSSDVYMATLSVSVKAEIIP